MTDNNQLYEEIVMPFIGDGDWTKKWADLEAPPEEFLGHVFSPDDLHTSLEELQKLYPPEFCLAATRERRAPFAATSLFYPNFIHHVVPTILLGLDLREAAGWERDTKLISELRQQNGYYRRRVEVGLWASLVRGGLAVERVAETSLRRTPDFIVSNGDKSIALEVKCLGGSDAEGASEELVSLLWNPFLFHTAFSDPVFDGKGLRLRFEFGQHIIENMATSKTGLPTLERLKPKIPDAVELIRNHLRKEYVGKSIEVPDFGHVLLTPVEEISFGFESNLMDTPFEDQVVRALRNVRDAADQNTTEHPLLVFVDTPIFCLRVSKNPEFVASKIEHAGKDETSPLRHVDGVILHNYWWCEDATQGMIHDATFIKPTWSRLTEIPRWLLRGLHNWHIQIYRPWQPARPIPQKRS